VWWPRLLPGAAASAAHGLIRTAHAVRALTWCARPDALLTAELAGGLAFWAARYQLLPGAPTLAGRHHGVDAITRLPRLDPSVPSTGPGIAGRLSSLIQLRDLPDALDGWGPIGAPEAALDELVHAAGRVLATRDDAPIAFCHAVTAPAAIQMVLPQLPLGLHRASVAAAWQVAGSIIAAFASPRSPAESEAADDDVPTSEQLAERAVELGDEHVIKLTEAAVRHHARTGDTTLLVAADRFRRRITAR